MRTSGLAMMTAFAGALAAICVFGSAAEAQSARGGERVSVAQPVEATAQSRRRPATRLRVYRNSYLPPNAVRTCHAWYEQEFRPSGTVIVPRMRCRWVMG
jgi:hypothetical protein